MSAETNAYWRRPRQRCPACSDKVRTVRDDDGRPILIADDDAARRMAGGGWSNASKYDRATMRRHVCTIDPR